MSTLHCTRAGCSGQIIDNVCEDCGRAPLGQSLLQTVAKANLGDDAATAAGGDSTLYGASYTSHRTASSRRVMTSAIALAYPTARTATARAAGSRRLTSRTTRGSTARRNALGGGLVSLPPMPSLDPLSLLMASPVVPAHRRICPNSPHNCFYPEEANVDEQDRRQVLVKLTKGYCGNCGTFYDYTPALKAGDVIHNKYEVKGPIAFGGLGWIYLAFDQQLSRWVVLKGLLNAKDAESAAAAVAERQYLAAVKHPKIVGIYDFVSHGPEGYIVMEYVGGRTLHSLRKERGPLPVEEAISYILGILPAFSYLHEQGYVYCDMKPDNVMLEGDDVKLVDLGAMRKIDDIDGAVYGTQGYMAPELSEKPDGSGPDVNPVEVSDIYTLGRTLANLIMDFSMRQHLFDLPTPAEQPVLAENESLYRFLLRATHPSMDERFQSAQEMADQLFGVLREIVALKTSPKPTESRVFSADNLLDDSDTEALSRPVARVLPTIKVDPNDKASADLLRLAGIADVQKRLSAMVTLAAKKTKSLEVRLRLAEAYALSGQASEVEPVLQELEAADPFDWRVNWVRGLSAMVQNQGVEAVKQFDTVYFEMPGETAPKLALAFAHEQCGNLDRAVYFYELVAKTDSNLVSASFGLGRCLARQGQLAESANALEQVAPAHVMRSCAVMTLTRTLLADVNKLSTELLTTACAALESVLSEGGSVHALAADLFAKAAALARTQPPKADLAVLGIPFEERALCLGAEEQYRKAARLAPTPAQAYAFVDAANAIRPVTTL